METRKLPLKAWAALTLCLPAAAWAGPILLPFNEGDTGYSALTDNHLLEQGAVEGRIGNRLDTGTWELGIWRRSNVGPFLNLSQLGWTNGVAAPFSIVYDGANTVTYTLGGVTISSDQLGGTFTDIFIRTRSANTGSIIVQNINMTGQLAIGNISSVGDGTINYLRVSNQGQNFGAFEITGSQVLTWQVNEPPQNSTVSAQFRFTNIVPAPGPVAALATLGLFAARRKRR